MKILITGSEGFIGSHLVPILKENKNKIAGIDLKLDGRDIFDLESEDVIKWADVVIHLAAITSVNKSFDNPSEYFRVNTLGTAIILELCQKYDKKLIFPSTGAYYHRELSPYAESKALAEDMVAKFPRTTILRLFNVYGTGMNPDSGSILYNFAQATVKGEPIVVYGSGDQTRDFISVKDVVEIIKSAINPRWDGKTIDIGTGKSYTINYIAELFSHYSKSKIVHHEMPKREIRWSIANTQMLKSLYKKKLKTNLEKDIKEIVEYYGGIKDQEPDPSMEGYI